MSMAVAGTVVSGASSAGTILFEGQPCTELRLGSGDRVRVAHHGAHVLSWTTADGVERLYLSPLALIDGVSAIRGGVPLCFPQFNMRVLDGQACPKHGFARTTAWSLQGVQVAPDAATATFGLRDDASTLALWPHGFAATLAVQLRSGQLRMEFSVHNTGSDSWPFALALHTYLQVGDVTQARLRGLQGLRYWDGVADLQQPEARRTEAPDALAFSAETDRVYEAVPGPLDVHYPGGVLRLTQSASLPEAVVWNPAAERCAAIADMPADGWKHMLCVEAACVNTPVRLAPGESWSGWQALAVQPG
jgi:glucose-6-phosphate 1-epimerase